MVATVAANAGFSDSVSFTNSALSPLTHSSLPKASAGSFFPALCRAAAQNVPRSDARGYA